MARVCLVGFVAAFLLTSCNKKDDSSARVTPLTCKDGEIINGIVGGKPLTDQDMISKSVVLVVIVKKEKNSDGKRRMSLCTATIVDKNILITAAHCLKDVYSSYVAFSADAACKVFDNNEEMIRDVDMFVVHEDYRPKNWYYADIAMLRIYGVVPEGFVPVHILAEDIKLDVNRNMFVAGFGKEIDYHVEETKTRLKLAEVKPYRLQLDKDGIKEVESLSLNSSPRIYVDQRDGHGVCNGDSGGPLFLPSENGLKLAGITSYGRTLGEIKFDENGGVSCKEGAVFTSAFYFKDWIIKTYEGLKNESSNGRLTH